MNGRCSFGCAVRCWHTCELWAIGVCEGAVRVKLFPLISYFLTTLETL